LRRTLIWGGDQGAETTRQLDIATGARIYFCDAASPSQRGSIEKHRWVVPPVGSKSTDLSVHTARDLARVESELTH